MSFFDDAIGRICLVGKSVGAHIVLVLSWSRQLKGMVKERALLGVCPR